MSEFELSFDEPTVILFGHEITMILFGRFEFDRHCRITKIYQDVGDKDFVEVCPVQSKPLYDALHAYLTTSAAHQERMAEVIGRWWGEPTRHRSAAWAYSLT
jgi:hypothetical protein